MVQKRTLRKLTFLLIIAGVISSAVIQNVSASENKGLTMSPHHGMKQDRQMSEEMIENHDAFLQGTKELRKNMAMKRAKMRAIMRGTSPDPERVAILAGELFDLREQMRTQAIEKGLPGRTFMGPMGSMGCEMMQHSGRMMGSQP